MCRQLIHILGTTHKTRIPFMNRSGLYRQQLVISIGNGFPSRMFENVRHGCRFVHELKVAFGMHLVVGGTAEDASVHECTVHITNHRPNISLGIPLPRPPPSGLNPLQIPLKLLIPSLRIRLIGTIYIPPLGYFHIGMREHKFINGFIEREPVRAATEGENEHGRGGVETVARGEELISRLEDRAGEGGGVAEVGGFASLEAAVGVEDSKHSPRTNRRIGIPTPIQRIKTRRQPPCLPQLGIGHHRRRAASQSGPRRHTLPHPILPILIERIRNRHARLMRPWTLLVARGIPRGFHHAKTAGEPQCVLEDVFGDLIEALHRVVAEIVVVVAGSHHFFRRGRRRMDQVGNRLACHLDGQMEGFHVAQFRIILDFGREPSRQCDFCPGGWFVRIVVRIGVGIDIGIMCGHFEFLGRCRRAGTVVVRLVDGVGGGGEEGRCCC
mmetsp:Transcript_23482/g.49645  ORF Transcript_23482/g.49645 Transcript_23482/m.49645 type:complete len:440 (-) Transcript_23482:320-1639(-)